MSKIDSRRQNLMMTRGAVTPFIALMMLLLKNILLEKIISSGIYIFKSTTFDMPNTRFQLKERETDKERNRGL